MLGESITVTINAVAKTLNRINQDGYSSEYLCREATKEYRMKIRHSKERVVNGGLPMDRHNVELTETTYATVPGTPNIVRQAYAVIRNGPDADALVVSQLSAGLTTFLSAATVQKLVGWES